MPSPIVTDDGGAVCAITAGVLNCNVGDLAAGASVTIEVAGTLAGGATSISNTASVMGAEIDPNPPTTRAPSTPT